MHRCCRHAHAPLTVTSCPPPCPSRRTPAVQAYGSALLGELLQRWRGLPYVKSAFSSTDFADLAEACAALFGSGEQAASGASASASGAASGSGSLVGEAGSGAGSGAAPREGAAAQLPNEVAEMLDEIAYEVRQRCCWRDLAERRWAGGRRAWPDQQQSLHRTACCTPCWICARLSRVPRSLTPPGRRCSASRRQLGFFAFDTNTHQNFCVSPYHPARRRCGASWPTSTPRARPGRPGTWWVDSVQFLMGAGGGAA